MGGKTFEITMQMQFWRKRDQDFVIWEWLWFWIKVEAKLYQYQNKRNFEHKVKKKSILIMMQAHYLVYQNCCNFGCNETIINGSIIRKTLQYWVCVQRNQPYLIRRRYHLGQSPFLWWCHNKNTVWCRCFITSTSLASYLSLIGWLKLNLILLLD